ncbi:MAG: MBL fold metallo-hydrolase [Tissierellia bacterium]|nr:MBL fold metallo-hydrolase [Tissierellia bacterium]
MYKELYPGIFHIEIPLRNNPLKALNCYVLKGEESLIIDTGFDTEENRTILFEALKLLEIDPRKTRLFLTHLHSDHTGLAAYLAREGVKVYMGEVDGDFLKNSLHEDSPHWVHIKEMSLAQGMEEDKLEISLHPGFRFRPKELPPLINTAAGDTFSVGDYNLEVLDLPGHTPGLQALYEKKRGFLFSGDHLLMSITPNITFWGEEYGDSLGIYLENLDKLTKMNITQIFSSHRELPQDHLSRIKELKDNHQERLDEIRKFLKELGPSTVRDITKKMTWDIRAKGWEDFPSAQKWFAAGEAHAHLRHLKELGEVKEEKRDGIIYFSLR